VFLIAGASLQFALATAGAFLEWRPRYWPPGLVGASGWLVDRHRQTNRTARVEALTPDKPAA